MQLSVFIAASLDGYIARPDGGLDWLLDSRYNITGEDFGFSEFNRDVDVLVMGRATYDKVRTFDVWPYPKKRVIVVTRKTPEKPDERVEFSALAPAELAVMFRDEGCRKIYLDGGRLIQAFLREKLVTDMTITSIPILLGAGIPLFGSLSFDVHLALTKTKTWPNGFVQSRYEVVQV